MRLLLLVLSSVLFPVIAFADVLAYSYNAGDDAQYGMAANEIYGQNFTTNSVDLEIVSIKVLLSKSGSPSNCTLSVKAVDGSHKPTGAVLTSGTIVTSEITGASAWYTVDVTDYELNASTEYSILIDCVDGTLFWRGDSSSPSGPYLVYSGNNGSTWTTYLTQTLLYEVYVSDPSPGGSTVFATSTIADTRDYVIIVFMYFAMFISGLIISLWILRQFMR